MNKFNPFLRYINITDFMPNNDFTIAYDCRMLYVLEGNGVLHTQYGDYELKENTFAYYPSGIKYFPQSLGQRKMRFITINFDFNDIHEDVKETLEPVPCADFSPVKEFPSYCSIDNDLFYKPFVVHNAVFLKGNLSKLYEVHYSNNEFKKEISSSLLKICIFDVLNNTNKNVSNELIDKIKDYILTNFNVINNNKEIADKFQYHEY